jgi:hypothetical protein
MLAKPTWAKQFLTVDFETDYPTDRESGYGPTTKRWMAQSRNWMKMFLTEKMGASEVIWSKGYYYWTIFAKIGEQWWYFDTGDVRYKTMRSMLVRKAQGPKDYTGGANQFVSYRSPFFQAELESVLKTGVSHLAPWDI